MNEVVIPYEVLIEIFHKKAPSFSPGMLTKFLDISQTSLESFRLTAIPPHKKECLFDTTFELLDIHDVPNAMPDYQGNGKIIKYTNLFDKKDPQKNLSEINGAHFVNVTDTFAITSIYIHPQMAIKNSQQYIDLYVEPAEECFDFRRFTTEQQVLRAVQALLLFDYVDSRLKKERHRIKRLMPTPEQIEQAEKTGEKYKSQPIVIKDVSVQYVYVPHKPKKYQRHCEAWAVRGHYRHYKNGKTIFIKPHVKGTGELKKTQYIIKE